MNKQEIQDTIANYIKKNFLFDENKNIDISSSLIQDGTIDSMGTIELISFLENTYKIRFDDDELIEENFKSIESISDLIYKKLDSSK